MTEPTWSFDSVMELLRAEAYLQGCNDEELRSLVPHRDGRPIVQRQLKHHLAEKGAEDGRGRFFLLLEGYVGLLSGTPSETADDETEAADAGVTFLRLMGPNLGGTLLIGASCALLDAPHTATIVNVSALVRYLELKAEELRKLGEKHAFLWKRALSRSHAVINQLTTRVALHRSQDIRTGYAALFWFMGTTTGVGKAFEVRAKVARRFGVTDGGSKQGALDEFKERKWVVKPKQTGKKYVVPDEAALAELAKVAGQAQRMMAPFTENAFGSRRSSTKTSSSEPETRKR